MQIIRNKGGYVIRVTNVEWDLLRVIHDEGMMGVEETHIDGSSGLSGPEKRILTEIGSGTRPWMKVTEDRRK